MGGARAWVRWMGALAATILLTWNAPALAQDFRSEINGYSVLPNGPEFTAFDLGGAGVPFIEHEFAVQDTDINGTVASNTVRAQSSAFLQRIGGQLAYHIRVSPDVASAVGPSATVDNYLREIYVIEPSDLFPEYAPINFSAVLNGTVSLAGRPSGGSYVGVNATFHYTNESGLTFRRFEWNLPPEYQYPPASADIVESWGEFDNVQVGREIRLEVVFTMDLNGSGHDRDESATNTLNFDNGLQMDLTPAAAGVGRIWRPSFVIHADGFEG